MKRKIGLILIQISDKMYERSWWLAHERIRNLGWDWYAPHTKPSTNVEGQDDGE